MSETKIYSVPGMHLRPLRGGGTSELAEVAGVGGVAVDLDAKLVRISLSAAV